MAFSRPNLAKSSRRGSTHHSKLGAAGTGTAQQRVLRPGSRFLPKSVHRVPPSPMYIGYPLPYVHGNFTPHQNLLCLRCLLRPRTLDFTQKSRTEPEYPLLRGPSASCTQLGPSPRGFSHIWPGKGHFGVFEAILTPFGPRGTPLDRTWTHFNSC